MIPFSERSHFQYLLEYPLVHGNEFEQMRVAEYEKTYP